LSRRISADETERDFPARIAQTRTSSPHRESQPGLKYLVRSTSDRVSNVLDTGGLQLRLTASE
jgi:hypothetical protein